MPNRYLTHFGENVVSMRQLLRRWNYERSQFTAADAANRMFFWIHPRLPLSYGYDPNGPDLAKNVAATANVAFTVCNVTPFMLLKPCFAGTRGSMNWMINAQASNAVQNLLVSRYAASAAGPSYGSYGITPNTSGLLSKLMNDAGFAYTPAGSALANQRTNAGLVVNFQTIVNINSTRRTPPRTSILSLTIRPTKVGICLRRSLQLRRRRRTRVLMRIIPLVQISISYGLSMFRRCIGTVQMCWCRLNCRCGLIDFLKLSPG